MTPAQEKQCRKIIHSAAVAAAAGNAVPIPGVGVAADLLVMTGMTTSLAGVLGGNITEHAAKGIAMATLKRTALRQPIRLLTKELSKLIPGLGQVVSPSVSVILIEATGWAIARELEDKIRVSTRPKV